MRIKPHWNIPQHRLGRFGLEPTQEWLDLRHAKITGTGLVKINGTPAVAKKYIEGIAWAIHMMPKLVKNSPRAGKDAARGLDQEPYAIEALEEKLGVYHKECAFIDITETFGLSPDFITEDMTVAAEVKCFQSESMAEVIYNEISPKNLDQVLGYFQIPTVEIVLYVLYCPAQDMENNRDFIKIITFDRRSYLEEIANMSSLLHSANKEILRLRAI